MTRCSTRDTDEVGWVCWKEKGHEGKHAPKLSDEAVAFILNADGLSEALFDLASVFNIPLTNNGMPWIDENGEPVYEVGDFIQMVRDVAHKFKEEL